MGRKLHRVLGVTLGINKGRGSSPLASPLSARACICACVWEVNPFKAQILNAHAQSAISCLKGCCGDGVDDCACAYTCQRESCYAGFPSFQLSSPQPKNLSALFHPCNHPCFPNFWRDYWSHLFQKWFHGVIEPPELALCSCITLL